MKNLLLLILLTMSGSCSEERSIDRGDEVVLYETKISASSTVQKLRILEAKCGGLAERFQEFREQLTVPSGECKSMASLWLTDLSDDLSTDLNTSLILVLLQSDVSPFARDYIGQIPILNSLLMENWTTADLFVEHKDAFVDKLDFCSLDQAIFGGVERAVSSFRMACNDNRS
ncbi:MAG: hypothetical protein RIC89_11080 [Pseudomonadales bacterium]